MASCFFAQPEEFVPNAVTNFTNAFTAPRSVKEQIDAAYLEGNSRWRQVRFNLSARFERTRTINRTYELTLSCRNVFNQALEFCFNVPCTIAFKDNFGAVWTLAVRGRF
jgi:hypothetical protein